MAIPATLPPSAQASLTTLATMMPRRDRCLPVDEALRPLFPQGGLARGQVTGFGGSAAVSLAVASLTRAVVAGSWLAVVGVGDFGVEAAGDLGLPLRRVVAVEAGHSALDWAERVAICADGFDVVLAASPPRSAGVLRRVRQRLQARGSVLAVIDPDPTANVCDAYLDTEASRWVGVGSGHGALLARMVTVTAAGRRVPGTRRHQVWLPSHTGAVEPVVQPPASSPLAPGEPVPGKSNRPIPHVAPPHGHSLVS